MIPLQSRLPQGFARTTSRLKLLAQGVVQDQRCVGMNITEREAGRPDCHPCARSALSSSSTTANTIMLDEEAQG